MGGTVVSQSPGGHLGQPSAADVRDQLQRMLASPCFAASSQRRALFRYLVDEALNGRAGRLKGFTIAVAVFGRDETFDPQADPIVRLEARRLRRDLDGYYANAGSRDPTRISVPKGAYVPLFAWQETGNSSAASAQSSGARDIAVAPATDSGVEVPHTSTDTTGAKRFTIRVAPAEGRPPQRPLTAYNLLIPALIAIGLMIAAVGGWLWNQRPQRDSETASALSQERGATLIVLPFDALSVDADDSFLAGGLSQRLITDLMRFTELALYSVPASLRQSPTADPANVGRDLSVAYVVKGSLRSGGGRVHLSVLLTESGSGRVLWSETYDRPLTPDSLLDVQEKLAGDIATRLARIYGVINDAIATRPHNQPP